MTMFFANFATKADLTAANALLKAELEADIHELKAELFKWLVGTIGVQTIVIIGALFAIMHAR